MTKINHPYFLDFEDIDKDFTERCLFLTEYSRIKEGIEKVKETTIKEAFQHVVKNKGSIHILKLLLPKIDPNTAYSICYLFKRSDIMAKLGIKVQQNVVLVLEMFRIDFNCLYTDVSDIITFIRLQKQGADINLNILLPNGNTIFEELYVLDKYKECGYNKKLLQEKLFDINTKNSKGNNFYEQMKKDGNEIKGLELARYMKYGLVLSIDMTHRVIVITASIKFNNEPLGSYGSKYLHIPHKKIKNLSVEDLAVDIDGLNILEYILIHDHYYNKNVIYEVVKALIVSGKYNPDHLTPKKENILHLFLNSRWKPLYYNESRELYEEVVEMLANKVNLLQNDENGKIPLDIYLIQFWNHRSKIVKALIPNKEFVFEKRYSYLKYVVGLEEKVFSLYEILYLTHIGLSSIENLQIKLPQSFADFVVDNFVKNIHTNKNYNSTYGYNVIILGELEEKYHLKVEFNILDALVHRSSWNLNEDEKNMDYIFKKGKKEASSDDQISAVIQRHDIAILKKLYSMEYKLTDPATHIRLNIKQIDKNKFLLLNCEYHHADGAIFDLLQYKEYYTIIPNIIKNLKVVDTILDLTNKYNLLMFFLLLPDFNYAHPIIKILLTPPVHTLRASAWSVTTKSVVKRSYTSPRGVNIVHPPRRSGVTGQSNYVRVKKNIDINHQDLMGNTALHILSLNSEWSDQEVLSILKLFLRNKKIMNLKNNQGDTPSDLAFSRSEKYRLILWLHFNELDTSSVPPTDKKSLSQLNYLLVDVHKPTKQKTKYDDVIQKYELYVFNTKQSVNYD